MSYAISAVVYLTVALTVPVLSSYNADSDSGGTLLGAVPKTTVQLIRLRRMAETGEAEFLVSPTRLPNAIDEANAWFVPLPT